MQNKIIAAEDLPSIFIGAQYTHTHTSLFTHVSLKVATRPRPKAPFYKGPTPIIKGNHG